MCALSTTLGDADVPSSILGASALEELVSFGIGHKELSLVQSAYATYISAVYTAPAAVCALETSSMLLATLEMAGQLLVITKTNSCPASLGEAVRAASYALAQAVTEDATSEQATAAADPAAGEASLREVVPCITAPPPAVKASLYVGLGVRSACIGGASSEKEASEALSHHLYGGQRGHELSISRQAAFILIVGQLLLMSMIPLAPRLSANHMRPIDQLVTYVSYRSIQLTALLWVVTSLMHVSHNCTALLLDHTHTHSQLSIMPSLRSATARRSPTQTWKRITQCLTGNLDRRGGGPHT